MLRIFMPVKIHRLQLGLNPRTWVPEASLLTTRPPKPSRMWIRKATLSLMIVGHLCSLNKKLWEFMVKCISVSYWLISELINAVGAVLVSYKKSGHNAKFFFCFMDSHSCTIIIFMFAPFINSIKALFYYSKLMHTIIKSWEY